LNRSCWASGGSRKADKKAIPEPLTCRGENRRSKSRGRRSISEAVWNTAAKAGAFASLSKHPDDHRFDGSRGDGSSETRRTLWADCRPADPGTPCSDPVYRRQAVLASQSTCRSRQSLAAQDGNGSVSEIVNSEQQRSLDGQLAA